jgi:hypothetical protein
MFDNNHKLPGDSSRGKNVIKSAPNFSGTTLVYVADLLCSAIQEAEDLMALIFIAACCGLLGTLRKNYRD